MAGDWYYVRDGRKWGPVSDRELRALARAGKLAPADLVWKEGTSEWRPAARVPGLFPEGQSAGPPLPPAAQAPAPGAPPDLAAAARGLLVAARATAGQFGAKAAAAARDLQANAAKAVDQAGAGPAGKVPAAPAPAAPAPGRAARAGAKRKVIVALAAALGGIGCLGLLFGALVLVAAVGLLSTGGTGRGPGGAGKTAGARGEGRLLASFDEHPAPVLQSLADGKQVWLLEGYHSSTVTWGEKHKEALYAILSKGQLEYTVLKTHFGPSMAEVFNKQGKEADVWGMTPAGESRLEPSKPGDTIVRKCEGRQDSEESIKLRFAVDAEFASNPDSILKDKTEGEVTIRWNKGGTKASWDSDISTSASVKTGGKTFPSNYYKHFEGYGKLLR
jgi:hypothetical protein